MVVVMTVGGFLAVAKDILLPRREITIQDMIELASSMSGASVAVRPEPVEPVRPSQYQGGLR